MNIDVIRRVQRGFLSGVAYQDKTVQVLSDMAVTFEDPEIGRSLALAQHGMGAEVIYNAAGRTGLGFIQAAREVKNGPSARAKTSATSPQDTWWETAQKGWTRRSSFW